MFTLFEWIEQRVGTFVWIYFSSCLMWHFNPQLIWYKYIDEVLRLNDGEFGCNKEWGFFRFHQNYGIHIIRIVSIKRFVESFVNQTRRYCLNVKAIKPFDLASRVKIVCDPIQTNRKSSIQINRKHFQQFFLISCTNETFINASPFCINLAIRSY